MKKNDLPKGVVLRDHTYDGIEEFDQKLPNWWLFTLYIAIVVFVVYWVAYYQLPLGMKSDTEKIEEKMSAIDTKREALLAEVLSSITNESLFEVSKDNDSVASGEAIFRERCVSCHGAELDALSGGQKLPGVNLVDAEWLYGGRPLDVMKTVTEGSPDVTKGMIAWKTVLSAPEIAKVVAYILKEQPSSYDPATVTPAPTELPK